METLLARALYDNTAECADELAFRKGDIITVLDQTVAGSSGWWTCSLQGRRGLAPANRLALLTPSQAAGLYPSPCAERKPFSAQSGQNIYQIPNTRRPSTSSKNKMEKVYKLPPTVSKKPVMDAMEESSSPYKGKNAWPSSRSDVYDVPSLLSRGSLKTTPTPRLLTRKASLVPTSEIQLRYQAMGNMSATASQSNVYAVPPTQPQDPSYDIPVPSTNEVQQRLACGYNTLPNPRKSEWIYDVPVSPEKPGAMPVKAITVSKQLYDTLPARRNYNTSHSVYDIPKPSASLQSLPEDGSPVKEVSTSCIYDIPPSLKQSESSLNAGAPAMQTGLHLSDSQRGHVPLECRGDNSLTYDHPRGRQLWGRRGMIPSQLQTQEKTGLVEEEQISVSLQATGDNQRSSTASTSSTVSTSSCSSCDLLALSSSSLELREVTLTQEEASHRLLDLQSDVCQAVPKLMSFVSSRWRSCEHLGQHLPEIRTAAEEVACSMTCFLGFALDVRGNAQRLTDSNLQARLQKQLSIVEDSGIILQQAVDALGGLGWPLDSLVQDYTQTQTPDQLERFVMVARTVPEDVKRLVSIINANGKLLFRVPQKEPESPDSTSQLDKKKNPSKNEQMADSGGDDNDYVQLQTKTEFEQQKRIAEDSLKSKSGEKDLKKQVPQGETMKPSSVPQDPSKSPLCDHGKLYFGAMQKAIAVFVTSILDGQPPEKFISHSKLVIMVGQRLVNTLCREAQSGEAGKDLLCKSNHLCALLKQLAVATKKAALRFPDKLALQEAQDFAKELAQRVQHYRLSMDI